MKNYKEIRKKVLPLVKMRINNADIEDVVQKIMIKIWETDDYEEQGKKDGWINTVAMNEIKDYSRKQKRQPNIKRFSEIEEEQDRMNGEENEAIFEIPDNTTPEQVAKTKDKKNHIDKLISKLPKEQKKCMDLYYKGYRNFEIQAILGKTHDNITNLIKLARNRLKKLLNEEEKISKARYDN